MRELLGKDPTGGLCYREFQGLEGPCDFCTNEIILGLGGDPYRWEHHNRLLDRYYSITDRIVTWPDGRKVRFELAIDITNRKRAEEALRESEERYRTLVEESFDGIFVQKGPRIVFANRRLHEMLDYAEGEMEGMHHWLVYHPDYQELTRERARARMRGEDVPARYEVRLQRKDGSAFDGEILARRIMFGEDPGIQVWVRDITERKRAEKALRESEEKYRSLVEGSIQGVLVLQDFRIVYANRRCEEITGYSVEELLSLPSEAVVNLIHREDQAMVWGRFRDRLQGKDVTPAYECRGIRKDGSVAWIEMYASLIEFQGRPAVQAAVVDITERRLAQESATRALDIIRSSPAVAFLWKNEEGWPVEFVSENVGDVLGYSAEDFLSGRVKYAEIIHPKDLERVAREVSGYSEEERRSDFVHKPYRVLHRNGKARWLDDRTRIVRDEAGRITHYQGIVLDITDKRRAEEKLKLSEERFRHFFENAPVYCYMVSPEGVILDVNKAALGALGYEKEELVGKPIMTIYPEDQLPRVKENIETWRNTGRLEEREIEVLTKGGQRRTVLLSASAVRSGKGKILHSVSVQRDVTERRHLEEQFRQAQKMEAIGRLAGGVAHDFNNLLTVIKGTSQLLLLDLREADPLRKHVEEILEAADRAAALTAQLLAFSRKQVMELRVIDMNRIVEDLEKMLRRIIGEDIELVTFLQEGISKVKADPAQIQQAIINLAVNARDAMPEGGKLTMETANVDLDEEYARLHTGVEPGPYVMLSMSDNGAGMTAEVKERVFEPFFTTKEMGKGTGLGLSTVYGIVKQSNGHIWVYSEPGRGTTFKIYLPRVEEPLDGAEGRPSDEVVPRGNETILVVEDEDALRELAVRILRRQGYKVLEASDGGEALMLCEKHREPIDLVLSDVVMPGMSGREVTERIQAIHPEAKALYMSGYTDNVVVHHGVLDKGTRFIHKPFTIDGLARKVRAVLDE